MLDNLGGSNMTFHEAKATYEALLQARKRIEGVFHSVEDERTRGQANAILTPLCRAIDLIGQSEVHL